ncbi:hypothetical protein BHE74_00042159 [Ensete ventricosum]|nr:hypothetical protein BHE74_00042159 [Ensete ventricosum]RZR81291.1 hypothetical protein BHM03_00007493 [Ensete ventricosum]
MNRSPPFWSHAGTGTGGDDDSMAVRRPPSVIEASEMDFFSELFGPLSQASGVHCAAHPVLAASVGVGVGVSDVAESSEDIEKESSSGMKSIPAGANDTPGCPSELDRASLLDEAIGYIKSLQQQLQVRKSMQHIQSFFGLAVTLSSFWSLQIMSGGGMYPAPYVSPPAMPCPRMPHFSPFPAAGLNLGMNIGIGMGVPGMTCSTGLSPRSSSFPATSLVPMTGVSPISHFQSPVAMHYWPYDASQDLPTLAPSTAVCSHALQAELFHSINQAESSCAEVKGATHAMAPVSFA